MALSRMTGKPIPFAFNRKEAKDHGEGGSIVGSPLLGNVLILDDVITAGTSVRESVAIIRAAGARPCGVLIALDREERGEGALSATEEVAARFDTPVYPIIRLRNIMAYLEAQGRSVELDAIRRYRESAGRS
jgi:orotate phosphoribosyltransferase